MKRIITLLCCFVCIFYPKSVLLAKTVKPITVIAPISGEIVSGLFTIKVAADNEKNEIYLCLIYQDGSNELKQMFQDSGYFYCNIDSRTLANGNLYFFVKTGKSDELINDSPITTVTIDNSESSLIGKIEPSLTRNGTNTLLSLQASIPLKNVWASLESGIKFDLVFNAKAEQWEADFFVPLTFVEGSHVIQFEGVDAGGNSVKTNASFMVCNSEPFFMYPINGTNILSKQIDLKGVFTPGEKVFIYQKKKINLQKINMYLNSALTNNMGQWILKNITLTNGMNTYSVFSKKKVVPIETFPYQTVSVEKYDQGLVVLNYHNITKNGGTFSRSPEQFREDMEFIKINDFNPITPILFLSYLEGKGNLPEKPVLITFDDGLNGVYLNAYPILQEYGYSAIMFIIVSRIGQNLDYLNWKQLSEMQSSRIFSIESHTYNSHFFVDNVSGRHAALISKLILPDGSIESEEQYVSRVTDDLQKSKSLIEDKLNKKVLFLAIPFGNGDPTITKISNNLGFKGTFNSGGGVNPLPFSSWNVKRITIKSTDLLSDYLY
jgi:peptidoglycan/xylan/chitin deacetylase (PgdA/CDA1 family)